MALDTVVQVLFDGEILISIGTTDYILHKPVFEKARINGKSIDVTNVIGARIKELEQKALLGTMDPFREVVCDTEAVYKAVPITERRGMNRKDVSTVLDAIAKLVKEKTQ